jgi:RimJ/RimL family protein N-acetyltransferase
MALVIRRFVEGDGAAAASWRYPPPYDVYDEDSAIVDDPALATGEDERYAVVDDGELVGFCTFGIDARVPGGTYPDGPLDVGVGMRPELTGRGNGRRFLSAVLEFAERELGASAFRATVAEFNARAIRLCEGVGFRRVARFDGAARGYWILER